MAADVIVFANQKGGVGKTLTISATAAILTSQERRVLMINMDAQRNLDMVAGENILIRRNDTARNNILTVLSGECGIRDAIQRGEIGDIVSASNMLYNWANGAPVITRETYLSLRDDYDALKQYLDDQFDRERKNTHILERAIQEVRDDYDYILIDTNPSITLLTTNALMASQFVVIPAFSERSSAEAVIELYDQIKAIRQFNPNKRLEIAGVLMTKFNKQLSQCRRFEKKYAALTSKLGIYLFDRRISASAKASEYVETNMDIYTRDPNCKTSQDYVSFVQELLDRIAEIKEGWK